MITHIMDLHIVWNYQLQKRTTAINEESKCQYSQNDYKTKLPHMEIYVHSLDIWNGKYQT